MGYKTKKPGVKPKTSSLKGIDSVYNEVAVDLEKQLSGMVEGRQPGDFHTPFEFRVQLDTTDVDIFKGDANEGLTKIAKDLRIKSGTILTRLTERPVTPKQLKVLEENLLAKAAKMYQGEPAHLKETEQIIKNAMDVLWSAHNQKSIEMGNRLGTKKFFWRALDAAVANFKAISGGRAGKAGYDISKAKLRRLTDAEIKEGILLTGARNMMEASLRAEGVEAAWLRLSKRVRVVAGQAKYEDVRGALMSTEAFTRSKNIRELLKTCGLNQAQVTEILGADSLSATGAVVKSISKGKMGFALPLTKKQVALLNSAVGVNIPAAQGELRPSGPVIEALMKVWRTSGAINLANAWGGGKFLYAKYLRNALKRGTFEPPTMAAREYMYRSRAGITGFFRRHASVRTVAIGYMAYGLGRGYLVPFVDYLGESFGIWEPAKKAKSLKLETDAPIYAYLRKRVDATTAKALATMINIEDLLPFQKLRVASLVSKLSKNQIKYAKNKKFLQPLVAELAKQVKEDTQYPTKILGEKPHALSSKKRMEKILTYVRERGSSADKAALKKEESRLKKALENFEEQEDEYELDSDALDSRLRVKMQSQAQELLAWADKYVEKRSKPKSKSPEEMAGILAQFGGTAGKEAQVLWVWRSLDAENVERFAKLASTVKGLSSTPKTKAKFMADVFKYVRIDKREDFVKGAIAAQKRGNKLSTMILDLPLEKYVSGGYMTEEWYLQPFTAFKEAGFKDKYSTMLSKRIKQQKIDWVAAPLVSTERRQLANSLAYLYSRTTGKVPATPKYEKDLAFLIKLRKDGRNFAAINNLLTASIRSTPKDKRGRRLNHLSYYQQDVKFLVAATDSGHSKEGAEATLRVLKEKHGKAWPEVRIATLLEHLPGKKELKKFGDITEKINVLFKNPEKRKRFTDFALANQSDPQLAGAFEGHRKLYDVLPTKTAEWVSMQLMGKNKVGRNKYNKALPLEYHKAAADTILALHKEERTGLRISLVRIQALYPFISQLATLELTPKKKAAMCLGVVDAYNPAAQKLSKMRSKKTAESFKVRVFQRDYVFRQIKNYLAKNPNATAAGLESQAKAYVYVLSKIADPQFLKRKKMRGKRKKQLAFLERMETYLLGTKSPTIEDVDEQLLK